MKSLAILREALGPAFTSRMSEINAFAARYGLREFTTWSKIWEYPWIDSRISELARPAAKILDLGSEISPMPWLWAAAGAHVMMVEVSNANVGLWTPLRERLRLERRLDAGSIEWRILPDETLPFDDDTFSVVTSFSVIEHMSDKRRAVDEAVRVLRPGGVLAISFDVCEPELGMTFPEWNGRALTMNEFDNLVWRHPALVPLDPASVWNVTDVPDFLQWHKTTAPHHNYVVGAAIMIRT